MCGTPKLLVQEPRSLLQRASIPVQWQDINCLEYEQQFSEAGFVQNLSVIDAILNCGQDVIPLVNS